MTAASTQITGNTLALQGSLIVETVSGLLAQVPSCPPQVNEIRMTETTELDSAGLALLVFWEGQIKQKGGTVVFVDVPSQAANLMQISGLQHMTQSGGSDNS